MKTPRSRPAARLALVLAIWMTARCGGDGSSSSGPPAPVPAPIPAPIPAPTPEPTPAPPPAEGLLAPGSVLVAIGDSITQGEAASVGWPEVVAERLAGAGRDDVQVFNEGAGGLSTRELWLDDPAAGAKRSAIDAYPSIDVAFLLIGHNDTRRIPTDQASPSEYQENVASILAWLRGRTNANGRSTQIVVIVPPPVREPVRRPILGFPADFNAQMQEPGGYWERLAVEAGRIEALFIETLETFDGGPSDYAPYRRGSDALIGDDSIHPNDDGQRALGELVYRTLQAAG